MQELLADILELVDVDGKMNLLVSLQEALQEVEDDLEAAHRMVNQCTSSDDLISNGQPSTQVGHDIYILLCFTIGTNINNIHMLSINIYFFMNYKQ